MVACCYSDESVKVRSHSIRCVVLSDVCQWKPCRIPETVLYMLRRLHHNVTEAARDALPANDCEDADVADVNNVNSSSCYAIDYLSPFLAR